MEQQLLNALVLASIYVLFSLGMTLAWGVLGILNLAHGAILVGSAYSVYLIGDDRQMPLGVVLALGLLVGGGCSLLLEIGVFRIIRNSTGDEEEKELRVAIASLGASSILVAIVAKGTANAPFAVPTSFTTHVYDVFGLRISDLQILIIVAGMGISLGLSRWLKLSRTGRAIRAVAADPETASLMGINERRLAAGTMFAAGAMAGLAGVFLVVYLGGADPQSGASLLTTAFAIIVAGGVGSIGGTVLGALTLALVETLILTYTSGSWAPAAAFVLIILVIVIRPQGLFSSSRTKVDRA